MKPQRIIAQIIKNVNQKKWKCLEKETTLQEVIDKVVKQYSIDNETAKQAVEGFIKELKDSELLDE